MVLRARLRLSQILKKADVFRVGNHVIIDNSTYEIASFRIHKGLEMITLKDFNDINQVLIFKGKNLFCDRELLKLQEDEYLLEDLIDMQVICNGEVLGTVIDYTNDANPLLCIKGEKDFYIPLKADFILTVDKSKKEIMTREETKELIL